jgi:hypothetical protein
MSGRPVISVILPSIRPELVMACVHDLRAAHRDIPTEIVVVADFAASFANPHTPWFVQPRSGVIAAIDLGYRSSRGDYVFLTNDQTRMGPDAIARLYDAAEAQPGRLLSPRHLPPFTFAYYGLPFAPFVFAHRDLITSLGGFLDPVYRAFYADPDLSMRAHAAGVPVEVVPEATIQHNNWTDAAKTQNWDAYFLADQATFRARWDHLGAFRDP